MIVSAVDLLYVGRFFDFLPDLPHPLRSVRYLDSMCGDLVFVCSTQDGVFSNTRVVQRLGGGGDVTNLSPFGEGTTRK